MKRSTIVFCLICISLCEPFFANGQSSPSDRALEQEKWKREALQYERVIFQSSHSSEALNTLLLNKAACYRAFGDFQNALNTIKRGNFYEGSDTTRFNLYLKAALMAYLLEEFKQAQSYLAEMGFYIENKELVQQGLFLEILVHQALGEWEDGRAKFKQYAEINNIDSTATLQLIEKDFPKLKDPKKAELLSYFLPGIGQWYAGYPIKGITSATIQLGFAAWGAYSIFQGYFFSGAFTGISLFYVFYTGGARHAEYLATQTNIKRSQKYSKPFKTLILDTERAKK